MANTIQLFWLISIFLHTKRYLGIFFVKGDGIYNFTKGNQIRFCFFITYFLRFAFRNYHLINGKKDKYNSCATSIMIQCYLLLAILYCIYVLLASFSTLFIFYGIYCGSDTLCFTVNTYSSIVWWHQNFFIMYFGRNNVQGTRFIKLVSYKFLD